MALERVARLRVAGPCARGRAGERRAGHAGGSERGVGIEGDSARVAAVISRIETAVALPARDASVAVDGASVRFIPAVTGRSVVRRATTSSLLSAFLSSQRSVPVLVAAP